MTTHDMHTQAVHLDTARKTLVIRQLDVAESDVVETATEYATALAAGHDTPVDLGDWVIRQLQLAATVGKAVGTGRDVEALRREMRQATDTAQKSLTDATASTAVQVEQLRRHLTHSVTEMSQALTDTVTSSSRQLSELPERVGKDITGNFTGEDNLVAEAVRGAVGRGVQDVTSEFEKRMRDMVERVTSTWDPNDPTSPIAQMVAKLSADQGKAAATHGEAIKSITDKVDALRERLVIAEAQAAATAHTASVTPLKGYSYEDSVHAQLDAISAAHGDHYRRTGTTTGVVKNCKKGDGVITLDIPGSGDRKAKVVVEMTSADRRDWTGYLDEAARNREAQAVLGIVPTIEQVPGRQRLRMWPGRQIVLAYDPKVDDPELLKSVLLLLRAQACLAASRNGSEQIAVAEDELNKAMDQLAHFTDLEKLTSQMKSTVEKAGTKVSTMRTALTRHIAAALEALHGAGDTGADQAGTVPDPQHADDGTEAA